MRRETDTCASGRESEARERTLAVFEIGDIRDDHVEVEVLRDAVEGVRDSQLLQRQFRVRLGPHRLKCNQVNQEREQDRKMGVPSRQSGSCGRCCPQGGPSPGCPPAPKPRNRVSLPSDDFAAKRVTKHHSLSVCVLYKRKRSPYHSSERWWWRLRTPRRQRVGGACRSSRPPLETS